MTTHELTLEEDEAPYMHDMVLPVLIGSCSCGLWTLRIHRYDALEYGNHIRLEHDMHVAMAESPIHWPTTAAGLHELFTGAYGDSTLGEHRKIRVPQEILSAPRSVNLKAWLKEALQQIDRCDPAGTGVVELEHGPALAALKILLERARFGLPKINAWCVVVLDSHRPWAFSAHHTRAEAELWAEAVTKRKERSVRVGKGPVDLYRLFLPGAHPDQYDW